MATTFAVGLLLVVLPTSPAQAAGQRSVELPLGAAVSVVATDNRVFISGGEYSNDVVVTDADGTVTSKLTRLAGPTGLALSPDRSTLYVALANGGAIAAFDTTTLRETRRYRVRGCPRSLAQVGHHLWFGYGCERERPGNIGHVDLRSPQQRPAQEVRTGLTADFAGHPLLAVGSDPDTLVAAPFRSSRATVYVYDVDADGTLTLRRQSGWDAVGDNLADVTLSPDGSAVFTASSVPYAVGEFGIDQLVEPVRRYEVGPFPAAVDLTADGALVAVGLSGSSDQDVFVFDRAGNPAASFKTEEDVVAGGLAWAPDGSRLYALTYEDFSGPDNRPHLHVLTRPAA